MLKCENPTCTNIVISGGIIGFCDKCIERFSEKQKKEQLERKTFELNSVINNLKCMITGKEIFIYYKDEPQADTDIENCKIINSSSYNDGVASVIYAGYGSKHDTKRLLIVLSDEAIDKLIDEGKIIELGHYF